MVLNIPLEEKSVKKLKALAMLSDIKVTDLEAEIANLIDQMLTENIGRKMAELDGNAAYGALGRQMAVATRELESEAPVVETKSEPTQVEDPNQHSLSEDDAPAEVPSIEEQIAKEAPAAAKPTEDDIYKVEISAPVVGNNGEDAEAYVDPIPAAPVRKQVVVQTQFGPARSAAKGFDDKNPLARVRVSDFTGDETDDQNWFKI